MNRRDYAQGWLVRVLSPLLERRLIQRAADEAGLSELDAVLRAKRGCRR